MKEFLTAEWRKLAVANYIIDPHIIEKYLPAYTEPDLFNGKCYVSLVGFRFINTRVLGLRIPFHSDFIEVNLRFYVRYKDPDEWKRGVVFIKEIVPKYAITFVANNLYGENYITLPMKDQCTSDNKWHQIDYSWQDSQRKWNAIKINAEKKLMPVDPGSEEEFILEHYLGYTRLNDKITSEYQVVHPKWNIYKVNDHSVDVNFTALYGAEFSILNNRTPDSVFLAEGSEVTVRKARRISSGNMVIQE